MLLAKLHLNSSFPVSRYVSSHFSNSLHILASPIPQEQSNNTNTDKNEEEEEEEEDQNNPSQAKPRSSKTKTARTMARLINNNPWSPDLESSLSTLSSSLSKTTVLQTLQLTRTSSKALRFFNWVQVNGFTHNDQTYFKMLEILGHSRNLNAARNLLFSIEKKSGGAVKLHDRFFNSLIRSYGQAGLIQESIKVFMMMKLEGVNPSVVTFNSLLSIMLRRGRTNMAKKLYYDEMLEIAGVSPDLYTFNILIRGFCLNGMVDEGFRFFKEMSRFECDPDVITYNTLVDGLCRAGKVRIAHNLVKGMRKKSSDLNPNIVTYTTLIRGYCGKQAIAEALDIFEEMVGLGLKPNRVTYNTLIQGLCEAQKLDKIKEILEGMIGGGEFVPDTCTLNTLMNAHCNVGKLDEALKVFEKMSELQVQPDSATYSVLVRSLCQRGDFERAEELFDELLKKEILVRDDGCVPLVASYNPMFEYLSQNGNTMKAEKVFRQLLKRGRQDPPSFKTLIMGHCREGSMHAGFDLLVLMLRRDFVPDFETYDSVIEGFLQKGEPSLAHKTLEKMLKSSHHPRTNTFYSILDSYVKEGCAREAASLGMMLLNRKIRPNINISTDVVTLLFKGGFRDSAFETLGLLYENGYLVKMEELIRSLIQNSKFYEARELLLFSLEKHQSVEIEMFNTVLTGLCKTHKALEAFGLYYELTEKGSQPGLSCLRDLKIALEMEGKSKEAEFVSKRMSRRNQA